jgi:hypothetical protein
LATREIPRSLISRTSSTHTAADPRADASADAVSNVAIISERYA